MRPLLFGSLERRLCRLARQLDAAPWAMRLLFSMALVAVAWLGRAVMNSLNEVVSPYATFYLAVEISALLGGGGAGLLATLASAGVASLWFGAAIDPDLALFVASCALFSMLAGAMRRLWLMSDNGRAGAGSEPTNAPKNADSAARNSLDTVAGTAAALAHEVNQPLAATVTYLKVARRLLEKSPVATPEVFQVLDKASEQTLRAGRIVTSLRDLVRRREPDKTLVGLNALLGEAVDLTENSDVSIRLEAGAGKDCVLADREQIRQVIAGLVRNACDAMRATETRRLVLSTSNPDANSIRLDVIDTGCGLPDSWENGAFEPFTTTKATGMGVGLSICRSIIERHDGRIWAEPNRDGGAVFSFILPLQELDQDA